MRRPAPAARPGPSSALMLGWVWLAVVVYASLFPFEGWRWPAGGSLQAMALPPWPRYFPSFDITSNLLGYLPLGLLLALARLRHGAGRWRALWTAVWASALTSYLMEAVQYVLPPRVPSALDLALNVGGGALGGVLAVALHASGVVAAWSRLRLRWWRGGNGGALALLVLWPVALLFPTPVPFGLGEVVAGLQSAVLALVQDVPWAQPASEWLSQAVLPGQGLSPLAQFAVVVLGLQAPTLLAFASARPGSQRLWLATGALAVGMAGMTLSTALNFGPTHALAWLTVPTGAALVLALMSMLALSWTGQRLALGLALVVLSLLVVLVNRASSDPYLVDSLQAWEQGRFIRFHGLAQWVGWLWPYAAMGWLLSRLTHGVQRD